MKTGNNNHSLQQLVVLSGKGGTGKTSISAALAHLSISSSLLVSSVLADADVDAANLELVLNPMAQSKNDFFGTSVAFIDQEVCTECGICKDICRFDAVIQNDDPSTGKYQIDSGACEGCAACQYQCPVQAIDMKLEQSGYWYRSDTQYGPLVHAYLIPGKENSGKLVTLVKQQARLLGMDGGFNLMIIDGPPGIGCPVISAASGADLSLIIAEPGVSGVHDMKRVLDVVDHFNIPAAVAINKFDIHQDGTQIIESFCAQHNIPVIGKIPFDRKITDAMVQGKIVTEAFPDSSASKAINKLWNNLYLHHLFVEE